MTDLDAESMVTEQCLQELLDFFYKNSYKAKTADRRVSSCLGRGAGIKDGKV